MILNNRKNTGALSAFFALMLLVSWGENALPASETTINQAHKQ